MLLTPPLTPVTMDGPGYLRVEQVVSRQRASPTLSHRMTTLACRACRTVLTAEKGCAVCDAFRRQIVVVGDRPEEVVDLGDLTTEALAAARQRLGFLRGLKPDDKRFNAREMLELIRTIAVMADAARKIRKEGVSAVKSMTFQERADLFVGWYRELPTAHREYVEGLVEAAGKELQ